ncbi:hypothetical protein ARMSODRAFT_975853 [Armillaria solidipes]|uniref:Uncharacterized protein n=1 Tax=Armillaria solidipes TaxID=1076256 RepID=A0A2H3BV52_9AGAR|nr:hypothetical protein ARMSODRAFT_975853 [Armillaria solidipes]
MTDHCKAFFQEYTEVRNGVIDTLVNAVPPKTLLRDGESPSSEQSHSSETRSLVYAVTLLILLQGNESLFRKRRSSSNEQESLSQAKATLLRRYIVQALVEGIDDSRRRIIFPQARAPLVVPPTQLANETISSFNDYGEGSPSPSTLDEHNKHKPIPYRIWLVGRLGFDSLGYEYVAGLGPYVPFSASARCKAKITVLEMQQSSRDGTRIVLMLEDVHTAITVEHSFRHLFTGGTYLFLQPNFVLLCIQVWCSGCNVRPYDSHGATLFFHLITERVDSLGIH